MSVSFSKGECGANSTQSTSEGIIANVKKDVKIKDEPLEDEMMVGFKKEFEEEKYTNRDVEMKEVKINKELGESSTIVNVKKDVEIKDEPLEDDMMVGFKKEFEEGKYTNRDVEMKEVKINKELGESSTIANVKKDVDIKDEPLEDDMMVVGVIKEFDEEEGKDTNSSIEIKKGIKVNKEPGERNDVYKDLQKPMNDVEMNVEPVQHEDEGTNGSIESESDSIESESEEKEYVNAIRNILGIVARPGTFACGGVLENAKLQLHVKGVSKIKLPLSFKQGEVLKSKCTAAPFGQGSETLVDKSVRAAWQVDAKDVTLDKKFDKLIKEKISKIIPTLMGESFTEVHEIESEFYKLVYYEKGGHFIAHRDTEKAPGMFGTLVIQLPAAHEGGALVVRHKGETKVFDFEDNSRDHFFFAAFFADCEHELRKITSGHRLVLIYNLIRNNSHSMLHPNDEIKPSNNKNFMTIMRKSVEDFLMRKSVEEWKSDNNGPFYLALKLDHLYTDTNTSFQNLKGRDKNIADALCSCTDIEVYLAEITKNETRFGYEDDPNPYGDKPDLVPEDEVETECSYILHNWMGVSNEKPPFGELELNANEMLIKEEYMFQKYEERCNSEYRYTGNEGCTINYFYKKKVLVFFPKSHGILISCDTGIRLVLDNCKKLSESKKDGALEMLKGIILYIEKKHDKAMSQLYYSNIVERIFETMILFEDTIVCLANTFLLTLVKPYSSNKVGLPNKKSAVALANLINKLSWESLGKMVRQLVKECAVSHTLSCAHLVSSLLSLGHQEQAIIVVEVMAAQIIAQRHFLNDEGAGAWAVLLASHDIFTTYFDDFVKQFSMMRNNVMIEIISQMHRSLEPKVINCYRIRKCFITSLLILQDSGWEKLTVKSFNLVWPVVLFVDKVDSDVSLLYNYVQAVIEHKYSSKLLEALLKCPNVVEAKNNPSIQLMVKKHLQQLDIPYPVFSWAQPDADLEMSFSYFGGPDTEDINDFLRSDEETKIFEGNFFDKADANLFGREYFEDGEYNKSGKYSARYELFGKGRNVKCKVIKTKNYFDEQVRKYNLMYEEAKVLKKTFCESKKTVSQKRPHK